MHIANSRRWGWLTSLAGVAAFTMSMAPAAVPADAEETIDVRVFSSHAAPRSSDAATSPIDSAARLGGADLSAALKKAAEVLPMIVAAVHPFKPLPTTTDWPRRLRLGTSLDGYAEGAGADGERFETFVAAARRILANSPATLQPPEATSRWFDETADAILRHVQTIKTTSEGVRDPELKATLIDLEVLAQLARFHARRLLGAVHYNLFRRSLTLGELYAATLEEQRAVAAWRALVAVVGERDVSGLGARRFGLAGSWREELKLLEAGLKDLEEQCCPPDEATLKQSVWKPFR